jgi:Flp pilus assembly protein TadG
MHTRFFSRSGGARASGSPNRRRDAGGALMMFTLLVPFLLFPVVGLGIDGTIMFSVKAKLQSAVDGAALAAAQSLSSGLTFTAQSATAVLTADEFIKANFVAGATAGSGYWGTYGLNDQTCDTHGNPTPSGTSACIVAAQDTTNKRTTVTVSASVNVPLLFMRILGFSSGTVASSAQAARRDVVMVLVIDRSVSMNDTDPVSGQPTMTFLRAGAANFVTKFQSTRDRLGLVALGGSAIVVYPPTDWGQDYYTGTFNGPDANFMTATPNLPTLIGQVAVGTNTGTADALMLAYKELQAAHQPGALNVVVLFTDGQPNGITALFNGANTQNPTNPGASAMKGGSTCTYKANTPQPPNLSMIGWIAQGGGFVAGVNAGTGVNELAQTTTKDSSGTLTMSTWLAHDKALVLNNAVAANNPGVGCFYQTSNDPAKDLTIPTFDYYGNPTTGSSNAPFTKQDYRYSQIYGDATECNHAAQASPASADDSCQVGLASWNAADMAGLQIRSDPTYTPVIYTMMFTGDQGSDKNLMLRLANINDPNNTVYDSTKTSGKYYEIHQASDIMAAFNTLAEEILRLSM